MNLNLIIRSDKIKKSTYPDKTLHCKRVPNTITIEKIMIFFLFLFPIRIVKVLNIWYS